MKRHLLYFIDDLDPSSQRNFNFRRRLLQVSTPGHPESSPYPASVSARPSFFLRGLPNPRTETSSISFFVSACAMVVTEGNASIYARLPRLAIVVKMRVQHEGDRLVCPPANLSDVFLERQTARKQEVHHKDLPFADNHRGISTGCSVKRIPCAGFRTRLQPNFCATLRSVCPGIGMPASSPSANSASHSRDEKF